MNGTFRIDLPEGSHKIVLECNKAKLNSVHYKYLSV